MGAAYRSRGWLADICPAGQAKRRSAHSRSSGACEQEDLRLRFFDSIKEFSPQFIARLTELDYARAMAFVAIDEASGETLGVVRLHSDAAHETAEYAILLRSDLKGRGLGWSLMQLIIEYAKSEDLKRIDGQISRKIPSC